MKQMGVWAAESIDAVDTERVIPAGFKSGIEVETHNDSFNLGELQEMERECASLQRIDADIRVNSVSFFSIRVSFQNLTKET